MPATLNNVFLLHRRSLMWSVMRIVRDPQTAEDVAQETYLRARKALEREPIEHIEAFLHQTARNLAFDHLRRRRTRGQIEADSLGEHEILDIPADMPSLEDAIIERERLKIFLGALSGLPERVQTVIMLSRIEEWSNRKIADWLGVSERTVFNDIKLAMAHCRDVLARLDRA
ncbi:RNA polymerase sigma factor [Aquamicrobium sp. LC103]|uniref:RNA polymerase sigma factor n=1 Tax=Aquamicrobium sp. LC103 TaxID=1120658 RepID=UPI00063E9126|nr:RNA polymerase sigma factor [Aquamicrobium sp. LC103]TKT76336.1 RNA polymerase sigma factor [Aquamicrobium sp. LC103]